MTTATSQKPSKTEVRVARRFNALPERVFDAWLDYRSASKWLFSTPNGRIIRAEINPHVGGLFIITDRREGEDIDHTGTYLEIDRPRRLVFTFTVPKFSSEATRVTIDITPLDQGCELTLVHEGVLAEYAERTQEGWSKMLKGLAAAIEPK